MRGILDRFEGEQAVILIEERKAEIIIKKDELPLGSDVNTVFRIKEENGSYQITGIDRSATKKRSEQSSALMNKLRAKSKGSKFKRK